MSNFRVCLIVSALSAMAFSCDSPQQAPPPTPTTVAEATPLPSTVAEAAPDAEMVDAAAPDVGTTAGKRIPPTRPPKSKVLVPEGAELVGQWIDTYSYGEDVPVAIYGQDGFYYFALKKPVGGRFQRSRVKKEGESTFLLIGSAFGEKFEVKDGKLLTLDKDGLIATSEPLGAATPDEE